MFLLPLNERGSIFTFSRSGGYQSAERAKPTVAFDFCITLLPVSGRRAKRKGYV